MIAFMDLEINSDTSSRYQRTDFSVLEVGMVVKESVTDSKAVVEYHSYVKPVKNNGKIYDRIAELTGIRQEDIDNGKTFPEVFAELVAVVEKYNITAVYTYGGYDGFALRQNCKLYDKIENKKKLLNMIRDSQEIIKQQLGLECVSLKTLCALYECNLVQNHNALGDAVILSEIERRRAANNINKEKLKSYKKWCKKEKAYNVLRAAINNMKQFGDVNDYIKMILNKEPFPDFE